MPVFIPSRTVRPARAAVRPPRRMVRVYAKDLGEQAKDAAENVKSGVKDAIDGLEAKAGEAAESVKDAVPDDAPAGFDKVKARRMASETIEKTNAPGGKGEDKRTGQGWPLGRDNI